MKPYALSQLWLCLGPSAQAADYRQLELELELELASMDTGNRETNEEVLGADRYQANGLVSLKASGRQAVMEGSFVLKRLDFKVGDGVWGDVGVVANEVTVRFHLLLGP